jgi:hypothetical protein
MGSADTPDLTEHERCLRAASRLIYPQVGPDSLRILLAEYDRRGEIERDFASLIVENRRDVIREMERLRAQRDAVLALHPRRKIDGQIVCGHCTITGLRGGVPVQCAVTLWPCPTAQAMGVTA